ncbi:hypothetical protein ACWDWV_09775, partial [Streptosporangium sandarakinum]
FTPETIPSGNLHPGFAATWPVIGLALAPLTVGGRPPHPPRTDRSRILPCPRRHDWRNLVAVLRQRPGTTLGAICDHAAGQAHRLWHELGATALAHLEAVDVRGLAADLGLTAPSAVHLPFPLLDETE